MWDTVVNIPGGHGATEHLSHDLPCAVCAHAVHTYLPCGDSCACPPVVMPGGHAA